MTEVEYLSELFIEGGTLSLNTFDSSQWLRINLIDSVHSGSVLALNNAVVSPEFLPAACKKIKIKIF